MKHSLLLTGSPGSGKTTIIKRVISQAGLKVGGFYTVEIREKALRRGFNIVTLSGKKAILAQVNSPSSFRVGKYGVFVENLDEVAVPAVQEAIYNCDLVIIDEIGKMELFSSSFRETVMEAIESEKPLLGTIMLKSHPWADKIKKHPSVELILVERDFPEKAQERVLNWLRQQRKRENECS